jgi:protein-disulfide isomerase
MMLILMTALALQSAAPELTPPQKLTREEPVEIVLYSDFQCPYCAQFAQPFRELQSKGIDGADIKVTFKHFPLAIHPAAQLAHRAAVAAKEQNKFWEMHDLIFANPRNVRRDALVGYAQQLGLDRVRFEKDMDSDAAKQAVAADVAAGTKAGVNGTPSYFINGKMYSGTRPLAQLKDLMVGEQRRARALAEVSDAVMSKGPPDAPITLELFADLQSPVSRPTLAIVNQLADRYSSAVRVQFRNFPLAFHPQAPLAHEAAMIAAREGRFWEFAAFVLDHQDTLREQDLIAYAGRLGLDESTFAAALREHRYLARVEADVMAGQRRGIRGSPAIVVNDKRIDGVPSVQKLTELIEAALSTKRADAGSSLPK